MNQVIGKYVGKFIPYPRQERVIRIPEIVYRMDQYKELSRQGRLRLNWIKNIWNGNIGVIVLDVK